jgi:hypothetical protein
LERSIWRLFSEEPTSGSLLKAIEDLPRFLLEVIHDVGVIEDELDAFTSRDGWYKIRECLPPAYAKLPCCNWHSWARSFHAFLASSSLKVCNVT